MPHSANHQNLQTLCLMRLMPLAGLLITGLFLYQQSSILLPWFNVSALLAVFSIVIAVSWWRSLQPGTISNGEFLGQLLIDVSLFTFLFFNTGGANNPFISYYLVPITIASITLPRSLTWLVAGLSLSAYSTLLFWYMPVPALSPIQHLAHTENALNLHIVGMWVNFVFSALLITYFISRMAQTVRNQQRSINRQKEQQLEDEQLLAVATIAASAAHELSTPLNTIRVIAEDASLNETNLFDNSQQADMNIILAQVKRCQAALKKLSETARIFSQHQTHITTVRQYFTEVIDHWLLMRPSVLAHCHFNSKIENPSIEVRPSLAASIHNILNNAADVSPQQVDITVDWDTKRVTLCIRDYGEGIKLETVSDKPHLKTSDKPTGMGLGLFLSKTILARHGADITLEKHPQGGTLATIHIPLRANNG